MDGGGFPSSSWASTGFSVDPSSPGSWGQDVRPLGGFMSYFANEAANSHLVGTPIHSSPLNDDTCDEMPGRPIGQKAAKMAALAAKKGKGSSSSDDGQSKESPIELDKFERYSKFQETNNDKRMKMLDRQEKIASDKLEATRIAQLTAQDYKEGKEFDKEIKMMETYNNLASQDTSSMSDEEKAQRVRMMQKFENALFPQTD